MTTYARTLRACIVFGAYGPALMGCGDSSMTPTTSGTSTMGATTTEELPTTSGSTSPTSTGEETTGTTVALTTAGTSTTTGGTSTGTNDTSTSSDTSTGDESTTGDDVCAPAPAGGAFGPCGDDGQCSAGLTCVHSFYGSVCSSTCPDCPAQDPCGFGTFCHITEYGDMCSVWCNDDYDCPRGMKCTLGGAVHHCEWEHEYNAVCNETPRPGEAWGPCLPGKICNNGSCYGLDNNAASVCLGECDDLQCTVGGCSGGVCAQADGQCFPRCHASQNCPPGMLCYEGVACLWPT